MNGYDELTETLRPHFGRGWPAHLAIGDGWVDLVADLHNSILALVPDYEIHQVKEKFGGLRYYVGNIPEEQWDRVHELIREAENRSYEVCEVCGATDDVVHGKLNEGYWIVTQCNTCRSNRAGAGPSCC